MYSYLSILYIYIFMQILLLNKRRIQCLVYIVLIMTLINLKNKDYENSNVHGLFSSKTTSKLNVIKLLNMKNTYLKKRDIIVSISTIYGTCSNFIFKNLVCYSLQYWSFMLYNASAISIAISTYAYFSYEREFKKAYDSFKRNPA